MIYVIGVDGVSYDARRYNITCEYPGCDWSRSDSHFGPCQQCGVMLFSGVETAEDHGICDSCKGLGTGQWTCISCKGTRKKEPR